MNQSMSVVKSVSKGGILLKQENHIFFTHKFLVLCAGILDVELLACEREKHILPQGHQPTDCYLKGMKEMDLTVPAAGLY